MILYVLRHAEAIDGNDTLPDQWRYLTEQGRAVADKTGSRIAKSGPKPRLTITSPLTRAVQTAEIAARHACRKNVIVTSELLVPGSDPAPLISYLQNCQNQQRILLVGHEPQLGGVVAALLHRDTTTIPLKKGSCVALEYDPAKQGKPAVFLWYLLPGKKRVTSLKKAFPRHIV